MLKRDPTLAGQGPSTCRHALGGLARVHTLLPLAVLQQGRLVMPSAYLRNGLAHVQDSRLR